MQAITWSKEEIQASVNAKLVLLRVNRQQDGQFNLGQRLELALDREKFAERQRAAQAIRMLAGAHMSGRADQLPLASRSGADLFLQRFEDGASPGANSRNNYDHPDDGQSLVSYGGQPTKVAKVRPDMSRAVDSHAVGITLKPGRPSTFVPHAIRYQQAAKKAGVASDTTNTAHPVASSSAQEPENGPPRPDYTELPAEKVRVKPASLYAEDPQGEALLDAAERQRRRLVEQTQRQASADWVVIDRATVLNCLAQLPAGMTMTDLATLLLGSAASARDTRRLSALMKREEQRATIAHAGRGNPITITVKGKAQLSAMDIEKAATAAVAKRQKRVNSQATRLILGGALPTDQERAEAKAARAAARATARAQKAAVSTVPKRPVGRPRINPLPITTVYKAGKPLPHGKPIKPSGRHKPKP